MVTKFITITDLQNTFRNYIKLSLGNYLFYDYLSMELKLNKL